MTPPSPFADHFVWQSGRVVPLPEARVSVLDRGFLYGDSVYEVTRTVRGMPLFWGAHVERMERSARGLGFPPLDREQLANAITQSLEHAIKRGSEGEHYIRATLTRGSGPLDLDPAAAGPGPDGSAAPALLVLVKPLRLPAAALYEEGAAVLVTAHRRNAPGHVPAWIKSGNYLSSVLAVGEARAAGTHEALLCGEPGPGGTPVLCEGASSNVFYVRAGTLHTAPEEAGILAGITRAAVLDLAREAGIPIELRAPTRRDLDTADEVFLSSSIRGVLPVTRIADTTGSRAVADGRPGPVTRRLTALYDARSGIA